MTDQNAENNPCTYFKFGLIVTGKTEHKHLPKLFKSLQESKICNFEYIGFVGQLSPKKPKTNDNPQVVGTNKGIPDKDFMRIGAPARKYLTQEEMGYCFYVILIDDLEASRREQAQQVFERYRTAMDAALKKDELKRRASVHFLVNMLEAYYFADTRAVNSALNLNLSDDPGDVEDIPHPKGKLEKELKKLRHGGFREIDDGGKILDLIDIEHVLARSDTCKSLRTLFKWCVEVLKSNPIYHEIYFSLSKKYQLKDGQLSDITKSQLSN